MGEISMSIGNIGAGGGGCGGAGRQQPTGVDMEARMQQMQSMSDDDKQVLRSTMQSMSSEDKQEFRSKMQSMSKDEKMEFKSTILNIDDAKGIEDFIAMLLEKNESLIGVQINTSA
jgi:ElaB/YqjD/DUF883 family membrane-anchored ribosome-binding protein